MIQCLSRYAIVKRGFAPQLSAECTPWRHAVRGFTLVELLIVIAILGLLSTFAIVSLNSARTKARDTKKQADFKQISTALQIFYDRNGRMPGNYGPGGACEGDGFYEQSMQELINAKLISSIPKSPNSQKYCYFDYGAGNDIGAILVTSLETAQDSVTGIAPSCRPWAPPGVGWCLQSASAPYGKQYCICNPY